jgi:hypothetical protein
MKQRTRYLVTCWVGAYALTAVCYLNGGHMSAFSTGVLIGAVYVLGLAAQKMVENKGGANE